MILVTGSAGHLGEALMRLLAGRGLAARGIDLEPSPFTDMVGSIVDRDFVAAAMADVRAVIHAATLHKPHVGSHAAQAFVDTNVWGRWRCWRRRRRRGSRASSSPPRPAPSARR